MTNKAVTFHALNEHFIISQDKDDNFKWLMTDVRNQLDIVHRHTNYGYGLSVLKEELLSRKKPHSIVWNAFNEVANECIKDNYPDSNLRATSKQLKDWLLSKGYDYQEIFKPLIEEVKQWRIELKKEFKEFEEENNNA